MEEKKKERRREEMKREKKKKKERGWWGLVKDRSRVRLGEWLGLERASFAAQKRRG